MASLFTAQTRPMSGSSMTKLTALPAPPLMPTGPIYMDAVLQPNRSLSQAGFKIVMLSLVGMSFLAGVAFVSMGAWPVLGFFGLDIGLLWLAFHLNYKSGAREKEVVRVTADEVAIGKTPAFGPERWWRVSPVFAKVLVERAWEFDSEVKLASGGTQLALATCLSPDERMEFAKALRAALDKARTERHGMSHTA
jgi:uncharacterized membrane protein